MTASASPPPTAPGGVYAGRVLGGRYQLLHRIAAGGMAEVWEAIDSVLGRHVAVKLLHTHLATDGTLVQRFRTEAVAAARLHHPSIVSIYDTISENGTEAIVMELIRGRTLRTFLDDRGPLTPSDAVDIGAEVADALHAAHCGGVIHRDVKPANILLCDDDRVMVTDFGIAKVYDDTDLTQTGIMLGSVKYLSPEQVESEPVDGRSDIYALGIVLYEGLTGVPPFTGDSAASMALARLHTVPPSPRQVRPGIPAALDQVVMRCLARDPADRYTTAAELRAALLATKVARITPRLDPDLTSLVDRTEIGGAPRRRRGRYASAALPGAGHPDHDLDDDLDALDHDDDDESGFDDRPVVRRRRSLTPVFVSLLVVAALGVAAVLVWKTTEGQDLLSTVEQNTGLEIPGAPRSEPIRIAEVRTFDPPPGDGREGDERVAAAVDDDPATGWSTEGYDTAKLGGIKPGVGFWVRLDQPTTIRKVTVRSAGKRWAGQVHVAAGAGATIGAWGPAVAEFTDAQDVVELDTGAVPGQYVLLWITDLGQPAGPGKWGSRDYGLTITDLEVLGG